MSLRVSPSASGWSDDEESQPDAEPVEMEEAAMEELIAEQETFYRAEAKKSFRAWRAEAVD